MSQLHLFPTEIKKSHQELLNEQLFSIDIENALMDVFANQPNTALGISEIMNAVSHFEAGHAIGHVLGRLARAGKITSKNRYFGSDHPAKPNYQGFTCIYKLVSNA